jgi:hypothetical protein
MEHPRSKGRLDANDVKSSEGIIFYVYAIVNNLSIYILRFRISDFGIKGFRN